MTTGKVCEPGGKNYCSYVGGENVRECEGLSLTFPELPAIFRVPISEAGDEGSTCQWTKRS